VRPDRKTILVVDDSDLVRSFLRDGLEAGGYATIASPDGADAVRVARERRPDAIVLDVVMPRLGGIEALRTLRGDDSTRDIPVLLVSGESGTKERRIAAALGTADFLEKPFRMSELLRRLERMLATTPEPPFDRVAAMALLGNDAALFAEIVELFRAERAKLVADLRRALDVPDARAVARVAHGVKGTVANFAARQAGQLAISLEAAAKDGALDEARRLVDALDAELVRLEAALAAECEPARSPAA
jgi:CheY-like chemotaxis protein/HPt (histidine-containing phosphotransfer) domain-containing protein